MLRLESLVLNNFKSFRHARINFSSGFNCVVGPNGSGKSNICDSILFALGELSQKRMRVNSYLQLINNNAKPGEDGLKKANVKLLFTGDAEIEVSKTIASNNKVKYRLNGVRSTRQEILDMLHMHKSEISEVNTIAQGEIVKFLELDSKERRELIEIAAGIKEFNDKKASSIKELEKVESKINEANIMLHERLGFLKDLEKEKNDAKEYIKLSTAVKSMNYTVLKQRESQAEEEYKKSSESRKEKAALKESLNAKILELDSKMSTLSKNKEAEAARIRGIADGFGAERIILLGDIKDTILYPERAELNMLSRFFSLLDGYKLDIVLGNHDAHFTDLFPVRKDQMHRELKLGNVTLLHGNRWPTEDGMMSDYIITAHNHVAISLVDSNKMLYREKAWLLSSINPEEAGKHYKSFNPRAKLIVMPAFNEMITGTPVNDKKLVSISPLIRNGVFDMKSSKVYSIRGEMLGTVEDFPDAPRTGKREGYRKRRVI